MFSEIKKRSRFLKQSINRSDTYNLLREATLAKYNKANVTKVLEHSLELDQDPDTSILKAIDFYAENLGLHPAQTKRNERIVLEYISKVRDIKQFRDSLKRRLGMHKNKANKVLKGLIDHQEKLKTNVPSKETNETDDENVEVKEFYSKALDEANLYCTADRIIRNYNEISRRFNIDHLIASKVTSINKAHNAAVNICEFVETYSLSPKQKLQVALESTLWGLTKNGCPFNPKSVARSIIEFFNFNENISKEEATDCLNKFNIYTPPVFNESVIKSVVDKAMPLFEFNQEDLYTSTSWDIYRLINYKYANAKDFSPSSFIALLNRVYTDCGFKILGKSFSDLLRIIDYIVNINPKFNKMDYYNAVIEWIISLDDYFFKLGLLDDVYCFNTLDSSAEKADIEERISEIRKDLYEKKKENDINATRINEGALLGKIEAIADKFKSTIKSLSDKEKTASATFDAAIDSIKKTVSDVVGGNEQEAREDVIADRYIPRASRVVKLALVLGFGYTVAPALSVIGLFLYIAKTVSTRTEERRRILNEIDVEIDMCKRYIKQADEKDDLEKVRRYKLILKKLQDTREQITSLMASKGENIYTADNKDED